MVDWSFGFDDLTVVMCVVVLTVSSLVHLYSIDYMAGDPHGQRFMSQLSLFTASMILLVTRRLTSSAVCGLRNDRDLIVPTDRLLAHTGSSSQVSHQGPDHEPCR